jgi:hypothetical protein
VISIDIEGVLVYINTKVEMVRASLAPPSTSSHIWFVRLLCSRIWFVRLLCSRIWFVRLLWIVASSHRVIRLLRIVQ